MITKNGLSLKLLVPANTPPPVSSNKSISLEKLILALKFFLFKRDNKPGYLKFLPYAWSLIERRLKNPVFKNLHFLMQKHLPIKKLKRLNKI